MTDHFEGERTLMRIFIGESDRCAEGPYRGRPLYEALLVVALLVSFARASKANVN